MKVSYYLLNSFKKAILKFYEDDKSETRIDSQKLLEQAIKEIDDANKGINNKKLKLFDQLIFQQYKMFQKVISLK